MQEYGLQEEIGFVSSKRNEDRLNTIAADLRGVRGM